MITLEITKYITWVIFALAVLVAACKIKINICFDYNAWLKRKDNTHTQKLKNLCPHIVIEKQEGKWHGRELLESPPGTSQWICSQCQYISNHNISKELTEYWIKHPKEYEKNEKMAIKLLKKKGLI